MDLTNPIYTDKDAARQHLEDIRWPNGRACPHCGEAEKTGELQGKSHRPGLYKCYSCNGHFTVTVGTVFEDSKVPLNKWILAAHLMGSSKKGFSAHQLHRTIGVTYKTAWFMMHRLREAMKVASNGPLGGGGKIVEADETFWGNEPGKVKKGRGYDHKMKVMSLLERDGAVRSFHIRDMKLSTLKGVLVGNVHPDTHLMTDEAWQYHQSGKAFAKHSAVNHGAKEYARGSITTNTIEGFFSIFKRGLIGTYNHVGSQHLKRYCSEFDFRYNHRSSLGYTDEQRAAILLKNADGKRLKYQ